MARQNKDNGAKLLKFAIIDEGSQKPLWARSLTKGRLTIAATTVVVVFTALIFSIIAFTPVRNFIPGYPDATTRRKALADAILIDSLENAVSRWSFYSENLLNVVEGRPAIPLESLVAPVENDTVTGMDVERLLESDSLLRAKVAAEEKFAVGGKDREMTIEGMQFFTPVEGVILKEYDRVLHPYLELSAKDGSVAMAVLGGSVISSHWDEDEGYVIAVQHDNNIISIYKNNRQNLRKTGEKVSAGTPLAIVGDRLSLEIWYRGEAVNPAKYIKF